MELIYHAAILYMSIHVVTHNTKTSGIHTCRFEYLLLIYDKLNGRIPCSRETPGSGNYVQKEISFASDQQYHISFRLPEQTTRYGVSGVGSTSDLYCPLRLLHFLQ